MIFIAGIWNKWHSLSYRKIIFLRT